MNFRLPALVAALFVVGSARAEIVTLGAPDTYTPGNPFTVNVGLTPVGNLGLYNVELVFRSSGATAGWLTIDPPTPAVNAYVFPTGDYFFGSTLVSGNEYRLTLSDFILDPTGPTVTAGVNDRIGAITLRPAADLTAPIEVSIDRTSLFVDDAAGNSLLTGGPLASMVIAPTTTDPNPVPAPAGVVLVVVGVGVLSVWQSRKSKARSDK